MKLTGKYFARLTVPAVCLFVSLVAFSTPAAAVSDREFQELKQLVQDLKRQLEAAERKLDAVGKSVDENAQAVEATAEAVEEAVSEPSALDRVSIGGYGELHYNNLDADDSSRDKDQIDFHRFVLFLGYEFADNLRLQTEFEVEHALAGEGAPGEVEVEQAFVEYDFNSRNSARAGLFLLPVGLLNETHEPPTFYGVERNVVENIIIPSTWWAGGIGYTHRTDNGFAFDLAVHEGLKMSPGFNCDTNNDDSFERCTDIAKKEDNQLLDARIRSGRQKTANAEADDFAFTGRIKYTGMPGLELAASVQHQQDVTQESGDALDDAQLYEAHIALNRGPFGLRALYAEWDIDVRGDLDDNGYDSQDGWYIEPSFKVTDTLGVFARFADVEGGRSYDQFEQWTAGLNFWLHEDVVLKADWQERDHDNRDDRGRDYDGFNLGVGYQF